ncbi:MAG: peptide-binding protein [Pseudomonadota bacterium]|nr:MAG: peptide-binding protein [Pseudomonadota bacterium]
MERRFTAKDITFLAFLLMLLISIILSMYQIDRQWTKMDEMQRTMAEQADDLRSLRSLVRSIDQRVQGGVVVGGAEGAAAADDIPDAFVRAFEASTQPGYQAGDWLVSAFSVGLKTITPLVSTDAYASEVQGYVQESLLTRDPDTLAWKGLIAEQWEVSKDGLTFTFKLRDDVKFSDGQPLTAHDVAFTFAFVMNDQIAAPRERAYYEKIASVTATADYEVVFVFREPYFNSLALAGGMAIMPRHFYEPYLKKAHEFNESRGLLLGSGPYRLKDAKGWTPDLGLVELERNPRYWGPVLPAFDRLLWKVIENDSARLTTYRNGEIDSYSARPLEYKRLLADEELTARSQTFEYMSPTAGYTYIGWNQQRGAQKTRFADARVRQAMTYLTDRQRIAEEIFLGYAEPAISPFNPTTRQHDPSLKARELDLDKARALLRDAGYADNDGDGVLEDADGKPFTFELVYFQDSEDTRRMVLFLKDIYARAGIILQPKPTEWSVMLDLINKRDFEAITLGWTSGVETDIFQIFHGSQTATGADNFVGYKSPELDAAIDEARATVDEDKRMPMWQRCERILYEDQPYTFLLRRQSLRFIDKRIHNLKITRLGLNLGSVPIEVYVPGAMHKYTN